MAWKNIAMVICMLIGLLLAGTVQAGEIHDAVRRGDLANVKELLKANPKLVAEKENDGKTPLYWAAFNGHKEIVELLIANGADLNARDKHGWAPLHPAAQRDDKEIAELLIANGADVDIFVALSLGMFKKVKTLLNASPNLVNAKIGEGVTLLHWAVKCNHKEMVELLLFKGADPNAKVERGQTPLHWAVKNNQREIAETLLVNGADVNAKDRSGWTALRWTDKEGGVNTKAFLSGKVSAIDDVNRKMRFTSPMFKASEEERKEMAELLRRYGGVE